MIVTHIGHQKLYQANPNTPLFEELRSIVLKTFGLADVIKEVLEPITKKISFAFIYGSIAKQENTVNSDIDLMIIGNNINYSEIFQLLAAAEEQLNRKINPTFYSLSEWQKKSDEGNHFVSQVKNQKKIFIIGTEDKLNELRESSASKTNKARTF